MSICMLCGGVGGARAALALSENLDPEDLLFVVNTGDDFEYLGMEIWPDWDTVIYTLAGLADSVRGWGRQDEGIRGMEELARLQAPTWFHLGDRDMALHVYRTWALGEGRAAATVAAEIAHNLGVAPRVLRLTERSLRTEMALVGGTRMDFQTWFVRHASKPPVRGVAATGAVEARLTPGAVEAIVGSDLLLIGPSNPYLSILPMLQVEEVAEAVRRRQGPTWAVSPLLGGKAVKGPLDSLIQQLSSSSGQQAVLDLYAPWVQRLLLPDDDHAGLANGSVVLQGCRTMLGTPQQRREFVCDLLAAWEAA